MADVTMCSGQGCLIKDRCKRYTSFANQSYQSYFMKPPFTMKGKKFNCDMYWGENQTDIISQLEQITKGEKNIKKITKKKRE